VAIIQVRRSLDNATLNIGFDGSGNLDSAALLAFVGVQDGYVVFGTIKVGMIDTSQI
jgi:hypothetical protein